jgi:uncharacterized protein YkwD
MRRIAWFAVSLVVVVACIEQRDPARPQPQAQAYPQQPPPGYYPPPQQYPHQGYPQQYPPQQYPPQQYPPQQPNQQRPPQPGPTAGQPAPQPTQQPPAPQPTQQPAPNNAPGSWGGLLDHLLGGGAPPVQWPGGPSPAPSPTTSPTTPPTPPAPPAPQISARSLDLANAINNYRKQNNLPPIPISKSLSFVAETHVKDLHDSAKPTGNCNGHSWSNKGNWTPCCYTPDHAQAKCMWSKPGELTQMKATGFEITIGQPGEANAGTVLDSNKAISMWQSSALHNDVILNRGQWQAMHWKAMGTGIIDSHACAWFSDQADPTP